MMTQKEQSYPYSESRSFLLGLRWRWLRGFPTGSPLSFPVPDVLLVDGTLELVRARPLPFVGFFRAFSSNSPVSVDEGAAGRLDFDFLESLLASTFSSSSTSSSASPSLSASTSPSASPSPS